MIFEPWKVKPSMTTAPVVPIVMAPLFVAGVLESTKILSFALVPVPAVPELAPFIVKAFVKFSTL